ncbi:hypothetical protein [Sphingobacterium prati]|uniref:hypothetical protein n=1 Tax=Sphingobacterium prati TaxID=2737006 RepID=UPI00155250CB|nr:hypothetical protein [Sphingobacterium prati]NPE46385.1 hypothetical protein [Sphingobacterium prati]
MSLHSLSISNISSPKQDLVKSVLSNNFPWSTVSRKVCSPKQASFVHKEIITWKVEEQK